MATAVIVTLPKTQEQIRAYLGPPGDSTVLQVELDNALAEMKQVARDNAVTTQVIIEISPA